MIPELLLAVVPVALILVISEYLWRKKIAKGERARKFIHILSGVWMAFWPLYLPYEGIFILGTAALSLLIYSRITNLFHAIYAVKRKTYGDVLFAVAIMVCAYLAKADWIFTTSILFMALADGGAAVAGRLWGVSNQYFVLGYKALKKSVAGTMAFIVLAYVAIACGWILGGEEIIRSNTIVVLITLPIVATLLENFAPYGLDNLLSPVFVTILLNSLQ